MHVGDRVRVSSADKPIEGVVLPSSDDAFLVLKRAGGYNVGVERASAEIEVLEPGVYDVDTSTPAPGGTSVIETDPDLPMISLVSTGGTIASTVDYRTGAVSPRFDVEDVLRAVPELAGMANYRGRVVSNILSENMSPAVWRELAEAVVEEIEAGADGVVVMHGTDTMQYTASAIAFMLDTPVPIVFTGSQRSADRPSSDNVMNAVCAVEAATADIAEVLVCMHATGSDDRCALHRATRVRKNHTSRRAAFETVGRSPLASISYADRTMDIRPEARYRSRDESELSVATDLEPDVELVKFVPGADAERARRCAGLPGLVIEGTGLGHVNTTWVAALEEVIADGTPVVMTSQCLEGRVCDRVYETGRDLLAAGVIEVGDMLPETALVKLMWVLANRDDVITAMREPLAGECLAHSRPWL